MSDVLTPKEQLTAYQRWELPAFDLVRKEVEENRSVVELPTAAQIEQIRAQAHEEGYQTGYAEGKQRVETEAQRLAQMINMLNQELLQLDQKIAQDLLDLSLEIARQMLQQTLTVKPELLLEIVQNTINELPYFNQHAHLLLHPDDAELVRAQLGEQLNHAGWKIIENNQIERGGCRVETAHSQVDATLATRWQRITESIGRSSSWLAP
ncbi:MAG: flagellar assembly protein FliH [Gallionellaceae bacterium]|nr:flagellar assembly protein FliH [Gallionellaceae bacterium]